MLVDKDDWATAISASVLVGRPIGAPILLTDGGDMPPVSQDVLDRLKPKGSDLSKDAQVIRVGPDVARPSGYKTALIEGDTPFERAAAVDRFFSAARGKPSNDVVLFSADNAEYAMPAAAWAARSGDAALPVTKGRDPGADREGAPRAPAPERVRARAGERDLEAGRNPAEEAQARARRGAHPGPEPRGERDRVRALPEGRLRLGRGRARLQLLAREHLAARGRRRGRRARHTRGIRAARPDRRRRRRCRAKLEEYFLSVQPGYEDDPSQAVYNRAWVLGDDKAVSVHQQAQLDQLTELIPVQTNAP